MRYYFERLKENRRIHVFCPASLPDKNRLLAGKEVLESLGFEVILEECCFRGYERWPYLACSDSERAFGMKQALEGPLSVAARGGYGTLRAIEAAGDFLELGLFMGFSDLTVLHAYVSAKGGLSIHGPNLTGLGEYQNLNKIVKIFEAKATSKDLAYGVEALGTGRVEAPLFAGNLAVLVSLLGTLYFPDLNGRILILEEVGEPLYRIDRYLLQLYLAGVRPAAVVFGDLGTDDPSLSYVIEDALSRWKVPGAWGLGVGHGKDNLPLINGLPYLLDLESKSLKPAIDLQEV